MNRPILLIAAASLVLATTGAALHAAEGDKAKAAPKEEAKAAAPSPEQVADFRNAALIMRAFTLAFQSDKVQQAVKGQLVLCLYDHKLSEIAAATNRVLEQNPSLKKDDLGDIYRASAAVCGVRFQKKAEEGAPKPAEGAKGDSRGVTGGQ